MSAFHPKLPLGECLLSTHCGHWLLGYRRFMSMLWIVFAAQLSLPVPVGMPDVRAVFSANDMPAHVQSAGVDRFVATRTTVRPDGTVQDCRVERASGDPALDALTCSI